MRRHPHVEPYTDDLLLRYVCEKRKRTVDMMAHFLLVTKVMVSRSKKAFCHH